MPARFNPPPGWPTPPNGWQPASDWVPDARWPPAPQGWQFWVDDDLAPTFATPAGPPAVPMSGPVPEPEPEPQVDAWVNVLRTPSHANPPASAADRPARSAGGVPPSLWLGWAGLFAFGLLGLVSGGLASTLIFLGLYVCVVGVVALARGRVTWARLGTRAAGGTASVAGLAVLLVGGAVSPSSTPSSAKTADAAAVIATTTPVVLTTQPSETAEPAMSPVRTSVTATGKTKTSATTRPVAVAKQQPSVKPKPRATKTVSKPKPKPTRTIPAEQAGVHPGAFCAPVGAYGTTQKGTLMKCTSKDGQEARWRAAA